MEQQKAPSPHLTHQLTTPEEMNLCDTSLDETPAEVRHPLSPVHRHSDPPQRLLLASSEFLAELKSKTQQLQSEASPERPTTPPTSASAPITPNTSPGSQGAEATPLAGGGLPIFSPELLQELKQSHSLRHVTHHKGLTTVFSGRGRMTRKSVHGLNTVSQSQVPVLPKASTTEN